VEAPGQLPSLRPPPLKSGPERFVFDEVVAVGIFNQFQLPTSRGSAPTRLGWAGKCRKTLKPIKIREVAIDVRRVVLRDTAYVKNLAHNKVEVIRI